MRVHDSKLLAFHLRDVSCWRFWSWTSHVIFCEIAMVIRWVVKHTEEINTFSQFMSWEEEVNLGTPINLSLSGFFCVLPVPFSCWWNCRGREHSSPSVTLTGWNWPALGCSCLSLWSVVSLQVPGAYPSNWETSVVFFQCLDFYHRTL